MAETLSDHRDVATTLAMSPQSVNQMEAMSPGQVRGTRTSVVTQQ